MGVRLIKEQGGQAGRHKAGTARIARATPLTPATRPFDIGHLTFRQIPSVKARLLRRPAPLLKPLAAVTLPPSAHKNAVWTRAAAPPVAWTNTTFLPPVVCPPRAITLQL